MGAMIAAQTTQVQQGDAAVAAMQKQLTRLEELYQKQPYAIGEQVTRADNLESPLRKMESNITRTVAGADNRRGYAGKLLQNGGKHTR